jgi:hypothetical protein
VSSARAGGGGGGAPALAAAPQGNVVSPCLFTRAWHELSEKSRNKFMFGDEAAKKCAGARCAYDTRLRSSSDFLREL